MKQTFGPWMELIALCANHFKFCLQSTCVRKGTSTKQVLGAFALMSHCTAEAYTALFISFNKLFEREKLGPQSNSRNARFRESYVERT